MVVLLAVGMMSYWWMALAGAFIFVEKRGAIPWAT
jgi:predicted metal-binding membrane protein